MTTAARESSHMLEGRSGKESWKVALEPGRRTEPYIPQSRKSTEQTQ